MGNDNTDEKDCDYFTEAEESFEDAMSYGRVRGLDIDPDFLLKSAQVAAQLAIAQQLERIAATLESTDGHLDIVSDAAGIYKLIHF